MSCVFLLTKIPENYEHVEKVFLYYIFINNLIKKSTFNYFERLLSSK